MSTKYAPFSPDEADDYNILVSDAEFYAINSSKISSALREKHRNVKECPLTTLSVSFREYAFHGVSKSTFVAGDYCFIEHVFHDLNATSEIIGAVFDIYYNDSGVIVAKVFEKASRDKKGNIRLHILYDPNDLKHNQLRIHFNQIISSSPELSKTSKLIEPFVKKLHNSISRLPTYEELNLMAPTETDDVIYLPIEGTYNKKFFSRLFLLRNHVIENIIISMFDMIQYQIPVKADNESLILLIYGTHLLEDVMIPDMLKDPYGFTMCNYTDLHIRDNSSIIDCILSVREIIRESTCDKELLKFQASYIQYEELVKALYSWIDDTLKSATKAYNKSEYEQVKWVSEYKLYNLVNFWYPDAVFQYSPDWLEGQSIDIFIPSESVGIEYQGRQHFEAVDYFGGDEKLLDNARRDQVKLNLCEENNVTLYYWMYDQKVNFSDVSGFLNKRPNEIDDQLMRYNPTPVKEILGKVKTYAQTESERKKELTRAEKRIPPEVIRQYSGSGDYLAEFWSIKSAAMESGVSMSSIQKCLAGERKKAGGCIWRREKTESLPQKIEVFTDDIQRKQAFENTGLPKPVVQIDTKTGEVIMIHNSIGQAARCIGINSKGIKDVITGKQKTAGGYFWQFVDQ